MQNFFDAGQLGRLCGGSRGIVASHQHMHVATHLGCGGQRLMGRVLE